jgi:hypothetical protein
VRSVTIKGSLGSVWCRGQEGGWVRVSCVDALAILNVSV